MAKGLQTLEFVAISGLWLSRCPEIRMAGTDEAAAESHVEATHQQWLANPVIKESRFEVEEVS